MSYDHRFDLEANLGSTASSENFSVLSGLINEAVRVTYETHESVYREAIVETDWDETPILRIIEPKMYAGDCLAEDGTITPPRINYRIERYAGCAPPISEYADGESIQSVTTITRPLLEQLAEEFEEIEELLTQSGCE